MRLLLSLLLVCCVYGSTADSREGDDHGNHGPLKSWFDGLKSGRGLCCSFADGQQVNDVDWDTQDGHYRVRLNGEWVVVPDVAVIKESNRFGPAVVWPYTDYTSDPTDDNETISHVQIRCFLPGAGT